ncbi:uncharacterized protein LOC143288962 isoform X2 [Babylonia areolata]|uniref:uncharacterized protein LOC143288962 isoform X2 n=1 Tax=Babylonia areolata TaxID=304850 RepID=UPI003FD37B70
MEDDVEDSDLIIVEPSPTPHTDVDGNNSGSDDGGCGGGGCTRPQRTSASVAASSSSCIVRTASSSSHWPSPPPPMAASRDSNMAKKGAAGRYITTTLLLLDSDSDYEDVEWVGGPSPPPATQDAGQTMSSSGQRPAGVSEAEPMNRGAGPVTVHTADRHSAGCSGDRLDNSGSADSLDLEEGTERCGADEDDEDEWEEDEEGDGDDDDDVNEELDSEPSPQEARNVAQGPAPCEVSGRWKEKRKITILKPPFSDNDPVPTKHPKLAPGQTHENHLGVPSDIAADVNQHSQAEMKQGGKGDGHENSRQVVGVSQQLKQMYDQLQQPVRPVLLVKSSHGEIMYSEHVSSLVTTSDAGHTISSPEDVSPGHLEPKSSCVPSPDHATSVEQPLIQAPTSPNCAGKCSSGSCENNCNAPDSQPRSAFRWDDRHDDQRDTCAKDKSSKNPLVTLANRETCDLFSSGTPDDFHFVQPEEGHDDARISETLCPDPEPCDGEVDVDDSIFFQEKDASGETPTTTNLLHNKTFQSHLKMQQPSKELVAFLKKAQNKEISVCHHYDNLSTEETDPLFLWGRTYVKMVSVKGILMVTLQELVRQNVVGYSVFGHPMLEHKVFPAVWSQVMTAEDHGKAVSIVYILLIMIDIHKNWAMSRISSNRIQKWLESPILIVGQRCLRTCHKRSSTLTCDHVLRWQRHQQEHQSLPLTTESPPTSPTSESSPERHLMQWWKMQMRQSYIRHKFCHSIQLMYPLCPCEVLSPMDMEERRWWRQVEGSDSNSKEVKTSIDTLGLIRFMGHNVFCFIEPTALYISILELEQRGLMPGNYHLMLSSCFLDQLRSSSDARTITDQELAFLNQFFNQSEDAAKRGRDRLVFTPYGLNKVYEKLKKRQYKYEQHVKAIYYMVTLGHHCSWSLQVTPPTTQLHKVLGYPHPEGEEMPAAMIIPHSSAADDGVDGQNEMLKTTYYDGGAGTPPALKQVEESLNEALKSTIAMFHLTDLVRPFCDCNIQATQLHKFRLLQFDGVELNHVTPMKFARHTLHCWKRRDGFYVSVAELYAKGLAVEDLCSHPHYYMLRNERVFLSNIHHSSLTVQDLPKLVNIHRLIRLFKASVNADLRKLAEHKFYVKLWKHSCPREETSQRSPTQNVQSLGHGETPSTGNVVDLTESETARAALLSCASKTVELIESETARAAMLSCASKTVELIESETARAAMLSSASKTVELIESETARAAMLSSASKTVELTKSGTAGQMLSSSPINVMDILGSQTKTHSLTLPTTIVCLVDSPSVSSSVEGSGKGRCGRADGEVVAWQRPVSVAVSGASLCVAGSAGPCSQVSGTTSLSSSAPQDTGSTPASRASSHPQHQLYVEPVVTAVLTQCVAGSRHLSASPHTITQPDHIPPSYSQPSLPSAVDMPPPDDGSGSVHPTQLLQTDHDPHQHPPRSSAALVVSRLESGESVSDLMNWLIEQTAGNDHTRYMQFHRACQCPDRQVSVFPSFSFLQCLYTQLSPFTILEQVGQAVVGGQLMSCVYRGTEVLFPFPDLKKAGILSKDGTNLTARQLARLKRSGSDKDIHSLPGEVDVITKFVTASQTEGYCSGTDVNLLANTRLLGELLHSQGRRKHVHLHRVGHICPQPQSVVYSVQRRNSSLGPVQTAWMCAFRWSQDLDRQVVASRSASSLLCSAGCRAVTAPSVEDATGSQGPCSNYTVVIRAVGEVENSLMPPSSAERADYFSLSRLQWKDILLARRPPHTHRQAVCVKGDTGLCGQKLETCHQSADGCHQSTASTSLKTESPPGTTSMSPNSSQLSHQSSHVRIKKEKLDANIKQEAVEASIKQEAGSPSMVTRRFGPSLKDLWRVKLEPRSFTLKKELGFPCTCGSDHHQEHCDTLCSKSSPESHSEAAEKSSGHGFVSITYAHGTENQICYVHKGLPKVSESPRPCGSSTMTKLLESSALEGLVLDAVCRQVQLLQDDKTVRQLVGAHTDLPHVVLMGILNTEDCYYTCLGIDTRLYVNWAEVVSDLSQEDRMFLFRQARSLHAYLYVPPAFVHRRLSCCFGSDLDVLQSAPWVCVNTLVAIYNMGSGLLPREMILKRFVDITPNSFSFPFFLLLRGAGGGVGK